MTKLRYHHLGIPTKNILPNETHLPQFKMFAAGYYDSPYGIEWMRFEEGCTLPELVQTVPHIAFVVDDLQEAIKGKKILIEPNSPSEGVNVAFIEDNGAPVEFLQFDKPENEVWPNDVKFKFD